MFHLCEAQQTKVKKIALKTAQLAYSIKILQNCSQWKSVNTGLGGILGETPPNKPNGRIEMTECHTYDIIPHIWMVLRTAGI